MSLIMQQQYRTFLTEDFIQDDYFIQWVNNPDIDSSLFWKAFLANYPEQREAVFRARVIVINLGKVSKGNIPPQDKDEIWDNLLKQIGTDARTTVFWSQPWLKVAAAACLLLLAGGLLWQLRAPSADAVSSSSPEAVATTLFETIRHEGNAPRHYQLPDQSKVTLQPGSSIRFVRNFDGPVRELSLSGEAFFEVTRNVDKPFIVIASQLVTKVLGTSFSVKAWEDSQDITVEVKTGKVNVFAAGDKDTPDPETKGMILRPNQKVNYSKQDEKMTRSLVRDPKPQLIPAEMEAFVFQEAPVPTILEAMKEVYQIEIVYDKETFEGCLLNTSLTNETLFQKLDVICEAINATYKVVDGEIIINGKKCS